MENDRTAPRRATYADLLAVPDHLVAEILDGELFTSPRPASPHALAGSAIPRRPDRPQPAAGASVTGIDL